MPHPRFAIAVELDADGAHPAAWRDAAHPPTTLLSAGRIAAVTAAAERLGFTAATFADAPLPPVAGPDAAPRLDAVQRAAFAAARTGAIGLIPVAHVVYGEPFHIATQLATLDWASAGRAGWIATAGSTERDSAAFGRPVLDDAAVRRERADVIEAARRLWDSWEDDAVIKDAATGRYLDRAKLHYVDVETPGFSVKGPLITPRPPQGQPLVLVELGADAGGIDADADGIDADAGGIDADADGADIATVAAPDVAGLRDAASTARAAGAPSVWAELEVALDARGEAAARRIERLDGLTPWRQDGRLRYVGDAAGLAALVAELSAFVEGVRLHPAVIDVDLDEIGRAVLPALRHEIGFRSPRAGDTLRESLGLARPRNRYSEEPA